MSQTRVTRSSTSVRTEPRDTNVTRLTSAATRPPPNPMASVERPFDVGLLVVVAMLLGIGIVMVYSASVGASDSRFGDPTKYLRSHLIHVTAGLAAFGAGMMLNYQVYRRLVYPVLGATLVLLLATAFGLGVVHGNARRWLSIGGFEVQPAELAKLAFVVYLAYSLEKKVEQMSSAAISFLPHVLVGAAFMALLIRQPDLGSAVVIASLLLAMQVLAGSRWSTVMGVLFVAVPVAIGYMFVARAGRMAPYFDPYADRLGAGFQTTQSLMSLGSGGTFGLGLGAGRQKLGFLTQSHTDFIFSTVGEELGLVGTLTIVVLFAFLCWRGFRAAWKAPDRFGRYLAFGITMLFGVQAFVNMGVATTLLPTKGLNLPFVSGGGTSMVISCLTAGILLNVSRYAEAPSTWKPYVASKDLKAGLQDLANMVRTKPKKRAKFKGQVGSGLVPFNPPRRDA